MNNNILVEIYKHLAGQHNQADHGRPKYITVYHGTVRSVIDNILKEGIRSSKSTGTRNFKPSAYQGAQDKVFVSVSLIDAALWANVSKRAYPGRPRVVVFEAQIPESQLKALKGDSKGFTAPEIPPTAIKRYYLLSNVKEHQGWTDAKISKIVEVTKASTEIAIFVPVLINEYE